MSSPWSRFFDRVELRIVERVLLSDGAPVALRAWARDLLIALTEQPGELLTKQQLLDRVWPGLVVEEANIAVLVAALRKVLGAGAIATVAGIGYRFAAVVSEYKAATPALDNLPGEPTPFIGRTSMLADAASLLATSSGAHPQRCWSRHAAATPKRRSIAAAPAGVSRCLRTRVA
jgi:DNA-binding winged helix-turn-helix (wHTH) protein